jgi:lactate permease
VSLISIIGFVQFWKPKYRPEFAASLVADNRSVVDEENIQNDNRSSSSHIDNDGNSAKYREERIERAVSAKEEKSTFAQTEKANEDHVSQHNQEDATEEIYENEAPPTSIGVQKPNTRETLLAWSPWVIIVVVVIM